MKKVLISLLAMVLLTGCAVSVPEIVATPAPTATPEEKVEPTVKSDEEYTRGVWEGNTYQSATLGFKFELPEKWSSETDEFKEAALEAGLDYLGEDEIDLSSVFNEFLIVSPRKDMTIQCSSSYLGPMAKAMSISLLAESMKSQFGQFESIVYNVEDEGVTTLANQEYGYLILTEETTGMEQKVYFRIVGEYMTTITVTTGSGLLTEGDAVVQSITAIE